MLTKCRECGVIFKTDNPKRKTCYNCKPELQLTVQFPNPIETPQNKQTQKQ